MDNQKLIKITKGLPVRDAISMLLSNHIDWGGDGGPFISIAQFKSIAEDLILMFDLHDPEASPVDTGIGE